MKKRVKFSIFAILVALAVVVLTTALFKVLSKKTQTIAFYGLSERNVDGIQSEVQKIIEKKNLSFEFVNMNSETKNIEEQLRNFKPALVFVPSGKSLESAISFADKKSEISEEKSNFAAMTSSIRGSIKPTEMGLPAVPILNDNIEIDIDITAVKNSGMTIGTWDDIENFAQFQKRYSDFPMIFAGKDSDLLIDIYGALAESLSGAEEYRNAVKIIEENSGKKFNAVKVARLLAQENDAPLNKASRLISKLYKNEILHPNVFSLTKRDVDAFIKARLASIVIMTLDDHRNCDQNAISKYSSIYFPSDFSAGERFFSSNIIFAVPLTKKFGVHDIIESLTTTETETDLSRATGLAPVLNHCRTPDKQADFARYWVAASNTPFAGLSKNISLTKSQKDQLCAELASLAIKK